MLALVMTLALGGTALTTPAAAAPGGPTVQASISTGLVNQATSLGIELSGFTDEQKQQRLQATVKFVDANGVEQNGGMLAAEQSGTSLVTGYDSYSGPKLGFVGTYAQVAAALATTTWTPSDERPGITLRIGLSTAPGVNQFYDANSGHYYEYVPFADDDVRHASEAFEQARTRTLFGLTGYMVHITSRAENDFIANETDAVNIWIGATDSAVEGEWRWAGAEVVGESDFVFGTYDGTDPFPIETAPGWGVNEWYPDTDRTAGWAVFEPNEFGDGEDYAVTNWAEVPGQWNDLAGTNSDWVNGYLVEYGGAGGQLTALSITEDVTLTAVAPLPDDSSAGDDAASELAATGFDPASTAIPGLMLLALGVALLGARTIRRI